MRKPILVVWTRTSESLTGVDPAMTNTSVAEEWRQIVIEGVAMPHSISSLGRVRRDVSVHGSAKAGHIMATTVVSGYHRAFLCGDGKRRWILVHRLVAAAFIGPRPDGLDVNHKNGIKADNRPENLEYCTRSQNVLHCRDVLGRGAYFKPGEGAPRGKLTEKQVRWFLARVHSKPFGWMTRIAKRWGVNSASLSRVKSREVWSHIVVGANVEADLRDSSQGTH